MMVLATCLGSSLFFHYNSIKWSYASEETQCEWLLRIITLQFITAISQTCIFAYSYDISDRREIAIVSMIFGCDSIQIFHENTIVFESHASEYETIDVYHRFALISRETKLANERTKWFVSLGAIGSYKTSRCMILFPCDVVSSAYNTMFIPVRFVFS